MSKARLSLLNIWGVFMLTSFSPHQDRQSATSRLHVIAKAVMGITIEMPPLSVCVRERFHWLKRKCQTTLQRKKNKIKQEIAIISGFCRVVLPRFWQFLGIMQPRANKYGQRFCQSCPTLIYADFSTLTSQKSLLSFCSTNKSCGVNLKKA